MLLPIKPRAAGNDDHNCNLRIMESETISDTNTSIISLHDVGFSHSPKSEGGWTLFILNFAEVLTRHLVATYKFG